jgi:tRNA-binding EMAP/Myf-like protein
MSTAAATPIDESRVAEVLSLLGVPVPAAPAATGTQMSSRLILALKQSGKSSLLGADDNLNDAEAVQWISLAEQISAGNEAFMKAQCKTLSTFLRSRSYLVGNRLSVADAAIFNVLVRRNAPISEFADLARYIDHISVLCTGKHTAASMPPTVFPIATSAASPAPVIATTPAVAEVSVPAIPAASSAKEEKKASKKDKSAAAAPAAAVPAAEKDEDELDPSKLDIRVGIITKCWEHPESDKLYCEEIDLGEAAPRQIASGLRAFYPSVDDLTGRKVLVLANLKERALAGFKSNVRSS